MQGFRSKKPLRIGGGGHNDGYRRKISRSPDVAPISAEHIQYCSTDDEGLGTSPPSKSIHNTFDVGKTSNEKLLDVDEDLARVTENESNNDSGTTYHSRLQNSVFPTPQNSGTSSNVFCEELKPTSSSTVALYACNEPSSSFCGQDRHPKSVLHAINGNGSDINDLFLKGCFRLSDENREECPVPTRRSSDHGRTHSCEWTPENSSSRKVSLSPHTFSRHTDAIATTENASSSIKDEATESTHFSNLISGSKFWTNSSSSLSSSDCSLVNSPMQSMNTSPHVSFDGRHTRSSKASSGQRGIAEVKTTPHRMLSDTSESFSSRDSHEKSNSAIASSELHARLQGEATSATNAPLEALIGYLEASATETSSDVAHAHYNHARRLQQQLQCPRNRKQGATKATLSNPTTHTETRCDTQVHPSLEADILRHYEIAASLGHTKSMVNAAVLLLESTKANIVVGEENVQQGANVKEQRVRAKKLLSQACDGGDARALLYVASLLRDGNNLLCVKADPRTAVKLLKRAVKVTSGDDETSDCASGPDDDDTQPTQLLTIQALMELTSCFLTGSGVTADSTRAFKFCHQAASLAAEFGFCGAKHSVATAAYAMLERMYSDGVGISADSQKAKHWYSRRRARNRHTHRRLDKSMG